MSAPTLAKTFRKGHSLNFKRGYTVNEKGYQRIKAGPDRDKYVHRKVMEVMLAATDTQTLAALGIAAAAPAKIPEGFTVEHLDHRRQHNCPENLLLLDKRIHDAISFASMCRYSERFSQTQEPDWVNEITESDTISEASALESEFAVLEVCK